MNKFFIIVYAFIMTMVMASMRVYGINFSFSFSKDKLANMKTIAFPAGCFVGGLAAKEYLKKQDPIAKAVIAGAFGCATGDWATGVYAVGTSLVVSGLSYQIDIPKKIQKIATDYLPKEFPFEETKAVAQIIFAVLIGKGFGNASDSDQSFNPDNEWNDPRNAAQLH